MVEVSTVEEGLGSAHSFQTPATRVRTSEAVLNCRVYVKSFLSSLVLQVCNFRHELQVLRATWG
jgi:hypothetical protein